LSLPNATEYFPKLAVQNNRIFYRSLNGTLSQLENDTSTKPLMEYLNPTLNDVETQELICAARMVHWAQNDDTHRTVQVQTAIELFKRNMVEYSRRYSLHDHPAKVCQLVCDIRHQGRASSQRIAAALATNGDYERAYRNLLTIGEANYRGRINTVKTTIKRLLEQGAFDKKYDSSTNSFVAA
jgi:hypothetical protein